MKKLAALSVVFLLAVAACTDAPALLLAPEAPGLELVETSQRLQDVEVNAWVFGNFMIDVDGGEPGFRILGADGVEEPANFPGIGVFYGGHCVSGRWYNPRRKATSGSMERPHPHCVEWTEGGGRISVILEPISSHYQSPGASGNEHLKLGHDSNCSGDDDGMLNVKFIQAGNPTDGHPNSETKGCGLIAAHAIDASTIWTTPTRIGEIHFDLAQFATDRGPAAETNLFDTDCAGETTIHGLTVGGCLSLEIDATYVAPNGETKPISGTLFWESSERTTGKLFNTN